MSGRLDAVRTVSVLLSSCLMTGMLLVACGNQSQSPSASTPSTSPSTSSTTTVTTTRLPPSAASDLATYFSMAAELDRRLKAAAVSANSGIGTAQISISQSTLAAIAAADSSQAAGLIPAGLTSEVLLRVLTVQSDLESRYFAFRGFIFAQGQPGFPGAIPISGDTGHYLMECLGNGAQSAASFPADLAAARSAATHAPPASKVAPSSRHAADLAIWLQLTLGPNSGCMECGGYRFTSLPPITWTYVGPSQPGSPYWDGHVANGPLFRAKYSAAKGWTIEVNAC